MSTSRKPASFGASKKISSWVRPGVCEVRASALRPVSALIRLDLPTLDRPANATSMPCIGGSVSIEGDAQMNCQSPAKSRRPCSISFASASVLMRRAFKHRHSGARSSREPGIQRLLREIPGSHAQVRARPGMTKDLRRLVGRFLRRLFRKRGLEVVEQLDLHAVLAHDEAL